ncbi:hypothetical protein PMAC_003371 [Pneumocystis sp. 'macacae']|nr:hypothetical protein PMAC_003371 [Pneumocystis sp. 'macacae']
MLLENPYARALVSPIRRDILTDARLPSAFLLRFLACINPQTNRIWILPNGLKHTVIKKIAQSRWIVNNKKCLKFIGRGVWKRILSDFAPSDAIWRSDMDDFVLRQFRKKIMIELKSIREYFLDIQLVNDVFVPDTKSGDSNKKIGCIIHKFDSDKVWYLKNVFNQEFQAPVINASALYDNDDDDNEDKWLRIFVSKKSIAIPLGIETVDAIFWLWRFRSYIQCSGYLNTK